MPTGGLVILYTHPSAFLGIKEQRKRWPGPVLMEGDRTWSGL